MYTHTYMYAIYTYIYKRVIALRCSIIEREREKERERVNFTSTRYFIGGIIDDIIDDVTPT